MNKVILLERHIKKQESERRLRIFDAESARVQLIYQKKYNEKVGFAGFIIKATPDKNKILPEYLCGLLRTSKFRRITINNSNRGTITNISQGNLTRIKIPVPDLNIQKKIVKDISDEYETIKKNENLISIFQNKINNLINSLWSN